MNKARTLLLETKLPKSLWSEAVRCAAYQINKSPASALQGGLPAKLYLNEDGLNKLKVFGSRVWASRIPVPRDKLEPRAFEGRMVGYGAIGYRIWDPLRNIIIISRDVHFNEDDFVYEKPVDNHDGIKITEKPDYQELEEVVSGINLVFRLGRPRQVIEEIRRFVPHVEDIIRVQQTHNVECQMK